LGEGFAGARGPQQSNSRRSNGGLCRSDGFGLSALLRAGWTSDLTYPPFLAGAKAAPSIRSGAAFPSCFFQHGNALVAVLRRPLFPAAASSSIACQLVLQGFCVVRPTRLSPVLRPWTAAPLPWRFHVQRRSCRLRSADFAGGFLSGRLLRCANRWLRQYFWRYACQSAAWLDFIHRIHLRHLVQIVIFRYAQNLSRY